MIREKKMALVLSTGIDNQTMTETVVRTAAAKSHRLAAYLVDGSQQVNPAQFDGIMKYLSRCPDKPRTPALEESMDQPEAAVTKWTSARWRDIPAGFYATPSATGNNDYDFWKVTASAQGFRSAKRVIGGSSTPLPQLVVIGQAQGVAALGAILRAGITESAALYAKLETRCSDCGRQLTDETSRKFGKGKICREKNG
jgi:hypothetical protein